MGDLEPFRLKFTIQVGFGGYYFISNLFNYDIYNQREKVNLSEWSVDSIIDVYIEQEYSYKEIKRIYGSPQNIRLNYTYNTKTHELEIFWVEFNPSLSKSLNLVIKFYSVSWQREKTLNQLLDETETG